MAPALRNEIKETIFPLWIMLPEESQASFRPTAAPGPARWHWTRTRQNQMCARAGTGCAHVCACAGTAGGNGVWQS
eukprot:3015233-Rhodomonas_salina.1